MKNSLLLFAVIFSSSVTTFSQQNVERTIANFEFEWNEYLLPDCSFQIYHGAKESYFLDSKGNRVPDHSYLDIRTGGHDHFIVQNESGYYLLNVDLEPVNDKVYEKIDVNHEWEIELTSGNETIYYTWQSESQAYDFQKVPPPSPPTTVPPKNIKNLRLGDVKDPRFKSKRIERLRLSIDMTKTLTTEPKGKNILVKKDGDVVFKGPTKPMLFYDFMITGSRGPHSLYHPISKDPILENCERFWCVESFLVVSIIGSPRKHIVSNNGKIVLSTAGEIRYYDYTLGSHHYSFFCDGRSVLNLKGDVVYKSDGGLIGVGEHYIYSGNSGGYLGDLTHDIKMNCKNFKRIGNLTLGQLGKNSWRLYDTKSILINEFNDFYFSQSDSILLCQEDKRTVAVNPYSEKVHSAFDGQIRGQKQHTADSWKFYSLAKDDSGSALEGRFDPKKGTVIEPKYLKIEWPDSEDYYIVVTKAGLIRYLNREGQPLFD